MSSFPTQARVVIIGGGVGGCSIAYHLAKLGWSDVVLLERHELTSGSTWHSAGLVGQLRSDVNLTRMMQYGTDLYGRLKAETGQDTGWRMTGGVRLASSPERLVELKRQVSLARSFGLDFQLISPQAALAFFPLMSLQDVVGAVYTPTDGMIDPTGLTNALAAGARAGGVQICTQSIVTGISLRDGRVCGVETTQGFIAAEHVVNAGGMWARQIAQLAGVYLPIIPMAHLYLITKPVAGVTRELVALRDPDNLIYYREEVGGLVAGGYEREPAPWGLDGVPLDFSFKLLPPDWERFTPLMENLIRRVPLLETAEVHTLLNGPEAFTPDGEYLLGPTSVPGFWVAAAFCAHGLAGAGGIGKVMAEWIVHGHPEWDVWRLDVRRFGSNYNSVEYTRARTVETYSKYYDIHYPNEERESVRALRLSPAYQQLQALGAAFGEKFGWERANWFEPHAAAAQHGHQPAGWAAHNWSAAIGVEHLAARNSAAIFDETSFSKLEVRGAGALPFLQHVCANDVDRPVGTVVYTQALNPRGGIECDFTVTRIGADRFSIVTGTAFGQHDWSWLQLNMPAHAAPILEDVTSATCVLGMWGPHARNILQAVTRADLSSAVFPYLTAQRIAVGAVPVLAVRVTYVGELGWELHCPMEYGARLWETLWEAGQAHGLHAGGYRAIDTLRLEKGYRYWSAELGPDYTPFEAGLGFAVKLSKPAFIGRAALVAQKQAGIQRKLCCLTLADPAQVCIGKEPVRHNGEVAGWVTSGGYGYSVEKSIAYAYLPVDLARPGTAVDVELYGELSAALVAAEPLWDPAGTRIKL